MTASRSISARKRRPWSPQNVKFLKTASRKKMSAKMIANRLNRTEGATRQKAFSMGLSLDTTGNFRGKITNHKRRAIAA